MIDRGNTYEIEDVYCDFVVRIEIFLTKFIEFSQKISK